MRVVVTALGTDLQAMTSPVFGRSPTFVFVDTETMQHEGVENPFTGAGGGAGIQAAQFVVQRGAQAVLSLNVGPNAFAVLHAAGVEVRRIDGGTVREAVEAFRAGRLPRLEGASVPTHRGLGAGGPPPGVGGRKRRGRGRAASA